MLSVAWPCAPTANSLYQMPNEESNSQLLSLRWLFLHSVDGNGDHGTYSVVADQVRSCVSSSNPILVVADGLSAYVNAFRRAFRSPLHTGKVGRPRLIPWPWYILVLEAIRVALFLLLYLSYVIKDWRAKAAA